MIRLPVPAVAALMGILAGAVEAQTPSPQPPGGETAPATAPAPPAPPPTFGGNKFPLPEPDALQAKPAPEVTGRLAVRAIQGTPDGPAIGASDVEVQLFHRNALMNTIETQLDEHGVVVLEDLPVSVGITPVVTVAYADVTYQQVGAPMDESQPQQAIDVICYETTETIPEWKVQMRHVLVAEAPEGLRVTEILVLENPGERTWLGIPASDGKRMTTRFRLTPQAGNVSLGSGFHGWCCTTFADAYLINSLPLMPKTTEMTFSYSIPAVERSATIELVAPAEVDHMMVIVPDKMTTTTVEGLELTGTNTIGNTTVRSYTTGQMQRGQSVRLSLTGLSGLTPGTGGGAGSGEPVAISKVIAAVGGGLILLTAVVLIFSRAAKPAPESGSS